MRRLVLLSVLLAAGPVLAQSGPAQPEVVSAGAHSGGDPLPIPGYWLSDNKVLSPISSDKPEKRCLQQKDVDNFVHGFQTSHYTCTYPELRIADGLIHLRGNCVDRNGLHAKVTGDGTYSHTSLKFDVKGSFRVIGLNIPFRASTESHRVGDICPKDAKRG